MNVREAIKALSGKEPDDATVQRLMASAHALGVKNDDPMIMLLMLLDLHSGYVINAPQRISQAVEASAKTAVAQAQQQVNAKLAELVPTISKQLGEAVKIRARAVAWGWVVVLTLALAGGAAYGWRMAMEQGAQQQRVLDLAAGQALAQFDAAPREKRYAALLAEANGSNFFETLATCSPGNRFEDKATGRPACQTGPYYLPRWAPRERYVPSR